MNRFEELISKYLDDTATPDDEAELARLIQTNGENRQEFFADYDFDQLLTVLHKPVNHTSIDAILTQVRAESDPFVESVVQEVREWEVRTPSHNESWWKQISRWLDGRRLSLGVSSALALALITGLLVWFFGPTMGDPILAEFQGNGVSVERGTEFIPASLRMSLKPADILRTGTNETATVTFGRERTRLDLHPGTELKLNEMSRGKRFALSAGKLEASVARQRPFRAMMIVTPQAEARVLGTKFTLEVDTNSTHLEVTEGKVRLTRASDGLAVKVTAGHYAIAATNAELAALPVTGRILREYWTNYPGTFEAAMSSDSTISDHPQGWDYITRFETPPNVATRSGERVRGYVHPPATGEYRFSIANTGSGEAFLFLSPDDKPENRVHIAEFATTARSSASDVPRKRSGLISLVAGRKYYIESLHEADASNGQLTADWQRPGGDHEIIPGEFLSPFPVKQKKGKP